jgi:elongation factor G
MKVVGEGPNEFQGAIMRTINQRRGIITGTSEDGRLRRIDAEVPLSEMFGYSTVLRSATQGKAEFSMEFSKYAPVPGEVAMNLRKQFESKLKLEDDE